MSAVVLQGGHSNEVLCIDNNSQKLISGGECGEIFLWEKQKVVQQLKLGTDEDVSSLCFTKESNSTQVYGSFGKTLFLRDLRNFKSSVWTEQCIADDINQICITNDNSYLGIANDTNNVCLMDLSDRSLRKLKGHTNVNYTAQFRDESSSLELVSGGYDCNIINWNCIKGKPYKKFDVNEMIPEGSSFVNPPYVLSLMFNRTGTKLACGIGNATIKLFSSNDKQLQYTTTLDGFAHSNSVCQVHFPAFADDLLFSGGNDGRINVWLVEDISDDKVPQLTIEHGEKINWLTSMECWQKCVIVCDTSSNITCHTLPG